MKKIFKVTTLALILTFILSINNVQAFAPLSYKITNTKDITIDEKVTITKSENDLISELSMTGSLVNDTESPYANPYFYQIKNDTGQIIKSNDQNYIFNVYTPPFVNNKTDYDVSYKFRASFIDYNINAKSVSDNQYYNDYVKKYLNPSDKIESDDAKIKAKSKEVVGNEKNPYVKAKKIFDFTYMYMDYDLSKGNYSALHALDTKIGVCEDYARLMSAMLRSQGIPARTVAGYRLPVDQSDINLTADVNYNHMWVEFYLDEYGWVPADPTITFNGKKIKINDNFASLKNYYIPLSIEDPVFKKYQYAINQAGDSSKKPDLKIDLQANANLRDVNVSQSQNDDLNNIKQKIDELNFPKIYLTFDTDLL